MSEIFHVLSRGVDKRKIFMDDEDRVRFIHNLYEFNDKNFVSNNSYAFRKNNRSGDITDRISSGTYARSPLVDIHAFCLMPNHYHLILSPLVEGGVVQFMKKMNIGYAKYFNHRYDRKGTLFEGRYKSVPVMAQAHFVHLPYYIHLNPLDMFDYGWRERAMHNHADAMQYLANYRWSSHLDYMGKKNFSSVTHRKLLLEFFGGHEGYARALDQWIKDISINDIQDLLLE